jgi:hypothetical protein
LVNEQCRQGESIDPAAVKVGSQKYIVAAASASFFGSNHTSASKD